MPNTDVAKEKSVFLIDQAKNSFQQGLYYDLIYLNERGSILAADIIQSKLSSILDNTASQ